METGVSKSQMVKLGILTGILIIVLLLNGKIKRGIHSFRNRSRKPAGRISLSTPVSLTKASFSGLKKNDGLIKELKQISPAKDAGSPVEEWPEYLTRDIFRFQRPKRSFPAGNSIPKKVKKVKSRPDFILEATFTGDVPLAVINNQPLTLGQSISGYRLREIKERQVVLTGKGREILLTLRQEKK